MSESCPKPADLPLAQEDRDALPVYVQRIIGAYSLVQKARSEALEERVQDLEARLGQDSSISTKPPSTDPPGKERLKAKRQERRGKRKREAQEGHKGTRRQTIAQEKVTHVVEHRPEVRTASGGAWAGI